MSWQNDGPSHNFYESLKIGEAGEVFVKELYASLGFGIQESSRYGYDLNLLYKGKLYPTEIKTDMRSGESFNLFLETAIFAKDKKTLLVDGYLFSMQKCEAAKIAYFIPLLGVVLSFSAPQFVRLALKRIERLSLREVMVENEPRQEGILRAKHFAKGYLDNINKFVAAFKNEEGVNFRRDFKIFPAPYRLLEGFPLPDKCPYASCMDERLFLSQYPKLQQLAQVYEENGWLQTLKHDLPHYQIQPW